jgi:S-DNA-T family DNA segregation ATPase FtsK/SpoIIIE
MPARVALRMEKPIDSQLLLNTPSTEALLGHGDLLFKDIGQPIRLQGAYLPPEERAAIFSTPPQPAGGRGASLGRRGTRADPP